MRAAHSQLGMLEQLIAWPRPRKALILLFLDSALVAPLVALTILLFRPLQPEIGGALANAAPVLVLAAGVMSHLSGLARIRLKAFASEGLGRAALLSLTLVLTGGVVLSVTTGRLELALPVFFGLLYFLVQIGQRALLLRLATRIYRHSRVVSRIAIYGASPSGIALSNVLRDRSGLLTCAFLDESPALRGAQLNGLPILEPAEADRLRRDFNIDRVILADPALTGARRDALSRRLAALGLRVESLPAFAQFLEDRDLAARLEPVSAPALLHRAEFEDTVLPIHSYYAGKAVLVSGAGGSIGRELCRQILAAGPARLIMLELSEPALYHAEAELRGLAEAVGAHLVPKLGSAGDPLLVRAIFTQHSIDVVLHAAAYKHVPIVEENPRAGLSNNVFATAGLARAALDAGVARFVLISSDKAVAPRSVMGASKRMAELVVQELASRAGGTVFAIVRFGNVLGSSGSVVPLFEEQIQAGGPLTLTDRRATRYFMTIAEAARLVLLCGTWDDSCAVYALDMGRPIRMLDLARQMVVARGLRLREAATPDGEIEIVEIGLRPGEKLHEEQMTGPQTGPTAHPKIGRIHPPCLPEIGIAALLRDLREAIDAPDPFRLDAFLARLPEAAISEPDQIVPRGVDEVISSGRGRPNERVLGVADPAEIEPLRRTDRAAGGAVACGERGSDPPGRPGACADALERADDRADLIVQKTPRAQMKTVFTPMRDHHLFDRDLVEGLHRGVRLAHARAESGEVVMSDQMGCPLSHRLDIERILHPPDQPAIMGHRRATLHQPEEVAPFLR
ncbi:MAG: polysaccharide biosynthesis protein [Rhodobacteraceae bacterium]|nr:MAG: polysaccharide biosynthesis protein [Paracoccaceae bacterium]